MIIPHYTPSTLRNVKKDIINAGTSNDNIKLIPLKKNYPNPKFYPRKFERDPDTFEISIENNFLKIRRSDVLVGGWGLPLLIDVEFDSIEVKNGYRQQKIPRVIYQTFEEYEIPNGMFEAIQSWKDLNPEYEHYYYSEKDRLEFIEKFFDKKVLDAYLSIIPGAFKADLWRCCMLYENGGVYVDSDMICLQSLNDYLEEGDEFLISRDDPMSKTFLANGFIASVPKHPFLKQQIDSIVNNIETKKECYYLEISGPALFGKSVNKILGLGQDSNYTLGVSDINGYRIKVLKHEWTTKTMTYDGENVLHTEYPGKDDEMKVIDNPKYYSLIQENIIYQEIPRNLYYTSKDPLDVNQYMVNSFIEKNKYWNFNYFTDKDCLEFFRVNNEEFKSLLNVDVLSYYETLTNGGEKSDFWRYCIIYLLGGVYSDSDTYCNVAMDKWVKHHDLILGIEANVDVNIAKTFGMDRLGYEYNNKIITVCNWSFASKPRHNFFKDLIIDICNNKNNDVLTNTGPGRITKHAIKYFSNTDLNDLNHKDLIKGKSILFNINRFGSNQSHSDSYKNHKNPFDCNDDVYIVHMFDGSWRYSVRNKEIKTFNSPFGVSHNQTIIKTNEGYLGVGRIDKDKNRTSFMKVIGDCRTLLEVHYDDEFQIKTQYEKEITNYPNIAKFEDYRWFTYKDNRYLCVSYIDTDFNTKVSILDEEYRFLGDVKIDEYNRVSFVGPEKIWEKNWLFFEKDNELYFIYSTNPKYVVYKCVNFETLEFIKHIDIEWPLTDGVPRDEMYFTKKVSTGGSTNPIYLKEKGIYLYFIHTKFYSERKYNHYAIILNEEMIPIKICNTPIFNKSLPYQYFFVSSVIETKDYLVFSGGILDEVNFIWELSKEQLYKKIKI
jgi:mannosyltransferase OCH1-like enzyme